MKKNSKNTDSSDRAFRFIGSVLKFANDIISLSILVALILFVFLDDLNIELKDYLVDPVCDFNFLAGIMFISFLSVWTSRWVRGYAEYYQQLVSLDYSSFHDSQNRKIEEIYNNISNVSDCENIIDEVVTIIEDGIKMARRKNEREFFKKAMEKVDAAKSELGEIKELMGKVHLQNISQLEKKTDDYLFAHKVARLNINANSMLFFISFSASGYAAICVSYAILTLDLSQGHSCKV